jgi:hypothetical protein
MTGRSETLHTMVAGSRRSKDDRKNTLALVGLIIRKQPALNPKSFSR